VQSKLSMVTIKAQSSPKYAVRYFREHLSRDDYYADNQHTPGRWFGRTGDSLGLDARADVKQEDFVRLCRGLRPDDGARLTQRAVANRRCLYDFTVSAPKSLSIMALLGDDERLIYAHDRAVDATLASAEERAAVRVRRGEAVDTRESRVTANIICARFRHLESRALDPQVHTHATIFNVTYDGVEKRVKALEARPLYDHARSLTGLYRNHLAKSLHALGYSTYRDRFGCVQIRGVSLELMAKFSKRSAQRDVIVAIREAELGRPLAKDEISHLIHECREKKQRHIDPAAMRRMQLDQLSPEERLGLDRLKALALAGPRPVQSRPYLQHRRQSLIPGTASSWRSLLRAALLVARAVEIDPLLFSPTPSPSREVSVAAEFVRQIRRTKAVLRYVQRTRQPALTR